MRFLVPGGHLYTHYTVTILFQSKNSLILKPDRKKVTNLLSIRIQMIEFSYANAT